MVANYVNVASLWTARHRLEWARGRWAELDAIQKSASARAAGHPIRFTFDRAAFEDHNRMERLELDFASLTHVGPNDQVHMLTGEVIYHLRTILDYVAYNLAWLDSGRERNGTKFPIVKDKGAWPTAKKCLVGVSKQHIDQVEEYSLHKGCSWGVRLVDLSNQDKHRAWFDIPASVSSQINMREEATVVEDDPTLMQAFTEVDPRLVFPDDDSSLVETLTEMLAGVDGVMKRFEPEFPARGYNKVPTPPGGWPIQDTSVRLGASP